MIEYVKKDVYTAEDLVKITALLRDPVDGCPWDKVQTHQSIRKNFLEETYEVLEAIDAEDAHLLREELGDVLMQIALHACMEEEQGHFSFSDVCTMVCEKLIGRHPHIFSDEKMPEDSLKSWELLKNKEKGRVTLADELNSVPKPLPALMKTQKTQKRAAPYGCVENTPKQVAQQLASATVRFQKAIVAQTGEQSDANATDMQALAGDLLFATVNQCRLMGVDAEEALAQATGRFVEQALNAQ